MNAVEAPSAARPTRMRRAVVRSVLASAAVPQFSVEVDIVATALLQAHRALREQLAQVSVIDLVHRATAEALVEHPGVNASFLDEAAVRHDRVNVGFIVEVADGMYAPAIANADSLALSELAAERRRLTDAALAGRLTPAELLSGTFTVSNLGPLGVHRFTAMVLPPQAGVLALGTPTPAGVLTLTLTCDHRVVDGAPAARFLHAVSHLLADPAWLSAECIGAARPIVGATS